MFISRSEAEKKFKISIPRLRQLERQGKIKAIDASTVEYEQRKKGRNAGPTVKVVYDEAQIAALKAKTKSEPRFARPQRRDALVFDMLAEGIDVPDIVRKLRLDLALVLRLRDTYAKEKDGIVVPGKARRLARENGFDLRPDNIVDILIRLLEYGRGVKPPKDRLARVKLVPDE
jgi:hypothetical protein